MKITISPKSLLTINWKELYYNFCFEVKHKKRIPILKGRIHILKSKNLKISSNQIK